MCDYFEMWGAVVRPNVFLRVVPRALCFVLNVPIHFGGGVHFQRKYFLGNSLKSEKMHKRRGYSNKFTSFT